MNPRLARTLAYYPATLLRGERVRHFLRIYRKTQWWPPEQIERWQLAQLKRLVELALASSAFYRERFHSVGLEHGSDIRSLSDVSGLPVLNKKDLIEHLDEIRSRRSKFCSAKTTGGSTGEPVTLYKNAEALARERAATWRCYEWAGLETAAPQARLWGVPHTARGRFTSILADVFGNRKRISAFDLDKDALTRYHRVLRAFKPHFIYGYASALDEYAIAALEHGFERIPSVKCVISTSEVLTDATRGRIESAFGVKCFDEYGCGEVGSIAHECEAGSLHIVSENLVVQDASGEGSITVTDLFNVESPLIRYRVGDVATIRKSACVCGRSLPILETVAGRAYDIVVTAGGRRVHPEALIYVFEDLKDGGRAIRQFQIIQIATNLLEIRVVPGKVWQEYYTEVIDRRMGEVLGQDTLCRINIVDSIPREKSGKMRVVKSELVSPQEP